MLCIPNNAMKRLHALFKTHLEEAINRMGEGNGGKDNYTLRKLPSATGCVLGSNHFKNVAKHLHKRFVYTTDFKDAYPNLDLRRLAVLLVFIFKYDVYRIDYNIRQFGRNELAHYAMETDPLYEQMRSFVGMAFSGLRGKGLAIGGPLSPYLLNLYCEVFLDARIRQYCERLEDRQQPERQIVYSRYVDDLTWSSDTIISSHRKKELRRMVEEAGFPVNHRKSKVLDKQNGTVFITKVGLEAREGGSVLVFPKKKRARLEGLIKSYLATPFQNDNPELITGVAAEFLHYWKLVEVPTQSDRRTFALCKRFEEAAAPYLQGMRKARSKHQQKK